MALQSILESPQDPELSGPVEEETLASGDVDLRVLLPLSWGFGSEEVDKSMLIWSAIDWSFVEKPLPNTRLKGGLCGTVLVLPFEDVFRLDFCSLSSTLESCSTLWEECFFDPRLGRLLSENEEKDDSRSEYESRALLESSTTLRVESFFGPRLGRLLSENEEKDDSRLEHESKASWLFKAASIISAFEAKLSLW
jgi:hypothetical protein